MAMRIMMMMPVDYVIEAERNTHIFYGFVCVHECSAASSHHFVLCVLFLLFLGKCARWCWGFLHFSAKLGTQINRKYCRTRHEEKNETKWMMIENCRQETKLARKSHCAIEFEDASDIPTSIFKAEIINFH